MKSSLFRRIGLVMLSVVCAVSITACGKKKDKEGGVDVPTQAEIAQAAKENIYKYQDFAARIPAEDIYVLSAIKSGDNVEFMAYNSDYEGKRDIYLCSLKSDGSDFSVTTVSVEDLFEGDTEDADAYVYVEKGLLTDDKAIVLCDLEISGFDGEDWTYSRDMFVVAFDKKGGFLWKTPIDVSIIQNDESYSQVSALCDTKDGGAALIITGDMGGMIRLDAKGSASGVVKAPKEYLMGYGDVYQRAQGGVFVQYHSDDWSKSYFVTYDPVKNEFGPENEITVCERTGGFQTFAEISDQEIYFANSNGTFRYTLGSDSCTMMMNYVNSDLDTYSLDNLVLIDDQHFFASFEDRNDFSVHPCIFSYVKPSDVKDKKTIVLAGLYVDSDEKSNVIRFNRNSDEYRISVRDYSTMGLEPGQELVRLNNDILAGNVPDILLTNYSIPLDSYVEKGLLANVDELIKNDAELSGLEYFDNVFEAYRRNGVLYQVIPRFIVRTYLGKKSIFGDRKGLTMADANKIAADLGANVFDGGQTRDGFMQLMMNFCGSDFVDLKSGKVNFDNQLFIDFLEYAKTLPEETQDSGYDEEYWMEYFENYYTQYRKNKTLLSIMYLTDLDDVIYQEHGMLGDEASYVGFPTENGTGSVIELGASYAISAKSENLDGAWKYLRFYMQEDYQRNEERKYGYVFGLPVLKKIVKEEINSLTERPYWLNDDGSKEYYDIYYYAGDEIGEIVIDPLSQKEADALLEFISGVDKPEFGDDTVLEIVSEEAGAFFAGSKSAKDVANTIQNRVQLYVNENR